MEKVNVKNIDLLAASGGKCGRIRERKNIDSGSHSQISNTVMTKEDTALKGPWHLS